MSKHLNDKLNDLFLDLDLPSDAEIRSETHKKKVSQAKLAFYQTPAGEQHRKLVSQTTLRPENIARLKKQNREERGVPSMFISPDGKEHKFQSGGEVNEFFGFNAAVHVPLKGAKRVERKELKNWIVIRLDGSATNDQIEKLKQQVYLKLNPVNKERDIEAWANKMESWRQSEAGKQEKIQRKEIAKTMGKKNARPIMTPDGQFESQALAAKFYGINSGSMSQRVRDHPSKYYKI